MKCPTCHCDERSPSTFCYKILVNIVIIERVCLHLRQYCFAKICNIVIIFILLVQVFLPDAHLFFINGRRKWPQWLLYPHLPESSSQPIHRFGAQNNSDSCRPRHAVSTSSGDSTRRSQPSSLNFTKGGHDVSSTIICVSLIFTARSYHHHVCWRE